MTTLNPKPPYPYRGLIPVNSSTRPIGVLLIAGTKSNTYQHQYNEFNDDTANDIFGNVFRSLSLPGSRAYITVVVVAVGAGVGTGDRLVVRAFSFSLTVVLSRVAMLAKARRPPEGGASTSGNHRDGEGTRPSRRHTSMRGRLLYVVRSEKWRTAIYVRSIPRRCLEFRRVEALTVRASVSLLFSSFFVFYFVVVPSIIEIVIDFEMNSFIV